MLQRIGDRVNPVKNARYEAYQMRVHGQNYHTSATGNSKEMLESMMRPEVCSMFLILSRTLFIRVYKYINCLQNVTNQDRKRKSDVLEDESDDDQAHDEVRLWEDGFKDRYYESKFDVSPDNLAFR